MNILKILQKNKNILLMILIVIIILKCRKVPEMFQSGLDLICPPSADKNKVNKEVYFKCVRYLVSRNYDLDISLLTCKNMLEKKGKKDSENIETFANFNTCRSSKSHLANMRRSEVHFQTTPKI